MKSQQLMNRQTLAKTTNGNTSRMTAPRPENICCKKQTKVTTHIQIVNSSRERFIWLTGFLLLVGLVYYTYELYFVKRKHGSTL